MTRRPDRGAVSIDYLAIAGGLIALFAALMFTGVGGALGDNVSYVFCKAVSTIDGRGCDHPEVTNSEGQTLAEQAYAGDYVALGDSYSSGEGADDYVDNTNSDDATKEWINDLPVDLWPGEPFVNICRRSANAYSATIYEQGDFQGDYIFGACSGAISDDYYEDNHSGNDDEGPQRDHITEDTSLITMSMGGNDFGFGDVMAGCVTHAFGGACGPDATEDVQAQMDDKYDELVQLYRDLAEDAPDDARLLIVGYPRLFPEDPTSPTMGIGLYDQPWINEQGDYANTLIQRAIRESGANIEYVDVTDALNGHESGTAEPWLHDLTFGVDGGNWAKPISNNSYHPTAEGQNAIAAIVQDAVENGGQR